MSLRSIWIALGLALLPYISQAESFTIQVLSAESKPVEHAVAALVPIDKSLIPSPQFAEPAVMDQVDRQFTPYVLAIQSGQKVNFPNSDSIKHHVYSFSEAKSFQLRLYKDKPPEPIAFEKPGVVALGCNIHDWMIGYIYVADSPWFSISGSDGKASIEVPKGEYQLTVWHPLMKEADLSRTQNITINDSGKLDWKLQSALHPTSNDSPADEFDDY